MQFPNEGLGQLARSITRLLACGIVLRAARRSATHQSTSTCTSACTRAHARRHPRTHDTTAPHACLARTCDLPNDNLQTSAVPRRLVPRPRPRRANLVFEQPARRPWWRRIIRSSPTFRAANHTRRSGVSPTVRTRKRRCSPLFSPFGAASVAVFALVYTFVQSTPADTRRHGAQRQYPWSLPDPPRTRRQRSHAGRAASHRVW